MKNSSGETGEPCGVPKVAESIVLGEPWNLRQQLLQSLSHRVILAAGKIASFYSLASRRSFSYYLNVAYWTLAGYLRLH